ncbi:flagellin, partial [Silanimonas sp.]|uniref:flagellin n=1 Tax=Silanimonas sp. TaxID=1929290 RepID=UPI0022CA3B96
QLVDEIDRVAKQAEFNGTKLLDGSFLGQLFQVGANAGQAIAIQKTANAQAASLGGAVFDSEDNAGAATGTATAAATITGISVTDSLGNAVAIDDVSIAIGDTGAVVTGKIVAAINAKIGETGVLATADGTNIDFASVRESVNASGAFTGFIVNTGTLSSSTAGITLASAPAQNTTAPASAFLDDLDISTVKGAGQALAIIDKALTTVNGARADLGAVQNRFQSVVANLNTSSENLTASRSRIRDADYAKETAELTRTQILQQAGTAMLAQANQIPQNVLSLLR